MKRIRKQDLETLFLETDQEQEKKTEEDINFKQYLAEVKPIKSNNSVVFTSEQLQDIDINNSFAEENIFREEGIVAKLSPEELRNIRKRKDKVGAILDLHSLNSVEAQRQLDYFVRKNFHESKRLLLVITGKGINSKVRDSDMGILKSMFLKWVDYSETRRYVVSYSEALPEDGGGGAFYLRLKNNKKIRK